MEHEGYSPPPETANDYTRALGAVASQALCYCSGDRSQGAVEAVQVICEGNALIQPLAPLRAEMVPDTLQAVRDSALAVIDFCDGAVLTRTVDAAQAIARVMETRANGSSVWATLPNFLQAQRIRCTRVYSQVRPDSRGKLWEDMTEADFVTIVQEI